jgi:hypothetical protein
MPTELKKKKIVYIMGLGRSGTTLMDVVLGNGQHCFSGGELCRYPLRKGIRRTTPIDSPKRQFWTCPESAYSLDNDLSTSNDCKDCIAATNTTPVSCVTVCLGCAVRPAWKSITPFCVHSTEYSLN